MYNTSLIQSDELRCLQKTLIILSRTENIHQLTLSGLATVRIDLEIFFTVNIHYFFLNKRSTIFFTDLYM